ncbi:HEAT repeat domain-containing protein [Candidatus Eisenbacteria bacterium]|uniref:HEAT repeat domain-containing protein n=1 Tax=Eiseniibacteriota bacterium TaxID=2212470 RepID=A0ABV6YJW1_UNCEI
MDHYRKKVETADYLPGKDAPFYLSKHRARFAPSDMKDICFDPYDPVPRLGHEDVNLRIEALTHIGLTKPPGADTLLAGFLERTRPRDDTYAAIRSLGHIGGTIAEAALLACMTDTDLDTQLEAVHALRQIESPRALPFCIQGLEREVDSSDGKASAVEVSLQRTCFEYLRRFGNMTHSEPLWEVAWRHDAATNWLRSPRPPQEWFMGYWPDNLRMIDPGILALSVLASWGDDSAKQIIVDATVMSCWPAIIDLLRGANPEQALLNDPDDRCCLGPGTPSPSCLYKHWTALETVFFVFQGEQDVYDEILERCRTDPRLPLDGRLLFLWGKDQFEVEDQALLRDTWSQAVETRSGALASDAAAGSIAEDLVACLSAGDDSGQCVPTWFLAASYSEHLAAVVAHAYARHGQTEELWYCYRTVPPDAPWLHGEVVTAMARTRQACFQDVILEYVREVWSATARSDEFASAVLRSHQSKSRDHDRMIAFTRVPIDAPGRSDQFMSYLFHGYADEEAVVELLWDCSLPSLLRLYLSGCVQLTGGGQAKKRLREQALDALGSLVVEQDGGDPMAQALAPLIQHRLR